MAASSADLKNETRTSNPTHGAFVCFDPTCGSCSKQLKGLFSHNEYRPVSDTNYVFSGPYLAKEVSVHNSNFQRLAIAKIQETEHKSGASIIKIPFEGYLNSLAADGAGCFAILHSTTYRYSYKISLWEAQKGLDSKENDPKPIEIAIPFEVNRNLRNTTKLSVISKNEFLLSSGVTRGEHYIVRKNGPYTRFYAGANDDYSYISPHFLVTYSFNLVTLHDFSNTVENHGPAKVVNKIEFKNDVVLRMLTSSTGEFWAIFLKNRNTHLQQIVFFRFDKTANKLRDLPYPLSFDRVADARFVDNRFVCKMTTSWKSPRAQIISFCPPSGRTEAVCANKSIKKHIAFPKGVYTSEEGEGSCEPVYHWNPFQANRHELPQRFDAQLRKLLLDLQITSEDVIRLIISYCPDEIDYSCYFAGVYSLIRELDCDLTMNPTSPVFDDLQNLRNTLCTSPPQNAAEMSSSIERFPTLQSALHYTPRWFQSRDRHQFCIQLGLKKLIAATENQGYDNGDQKSEPGSSPSPS
jgi:hypothetical protein